MIFGTVATIQQENKDCNTELQFYELICIYYVFNAYLYTQENSTFAFCPVPLEKSFLFLQPDLPVIRIFGEGSFRSIFRSVMHK